tara:strand:+ start:3457 stop:4620 length:1164 start_codon:yes stop_codon:yes gene_type:complete
MSEEIKETKGGELTQGEFKVKKKPKKLNKKQEDLKVDLSKTKEKEEIKETPKVDLKETPKVNLKEIKEEVKEEVKEETIKTNKNTSNPISVIDKKEDIEEPKKEIVTKVDTPKIELPKNVEKLVSFMKETGGTVEDYVRLNRDYSSIDEDTLLKEYYKNTKPHLNQEEVNFIMEDNFSFDEEMDEERDVKKKKLAFKEEIAKAKNFLEETKSKYYDEIKLRPGVTQEQQKAMDFFNRYNEEVQQEKTLHESFLNTTKEYLSEDFKGFEFNLGDKNFRYSVNDVKKVAEQQSDIANFIQKFMGEDGSIKDYKGYHKAIYAAQNSDTIAQHFYEQGKADGIKDLVNKSKNIETASRPQDNGDIFVGGFKVKSVSGVDSSKLKIQKRNKN